jgi:hypothetical protein
MRRALLTALVLAVAATPATAATRYGDLTFPADEHAQPSSWDYWWGAADLRTTSGNRYVMPFGFTSLDGNMVASYIVYPLQGPYRGQGVMSMEGPPEWGHPNPAGRPVYTMTMNVAGLREKLLRLDTRDAGKGFKLVSRYERTTLERDRYRLRLDHDDAKLHPAGGQAGLHMDLRMDMQTPLLAGGTGRWFYGVPEDYGYPSRAFQYQQVTRRLRGGFTLTMPDGTRLRERVDPRTSTLSLTHESNPKEAIPTGIALALSSQIHPRYLQSYNLQWPWELIYADLGNGAQLMFDLQTYHDTPRGLIDVNPKQPTYRVLATLRLKDGTNVRLDDQLHAEHLEMRTLDNIASMTGNGLATPWTQGWRFRVSHPGGTVAAPDGRPVRVPPFDLGLTPHFTKAEPPADAANNRLTQRVSFAVSGHYARCPVDGFAWSELLTNWYGWEDRDPWFTGGSLPVTPKRCRKKLPPIPTGTVGELNPPREPVVPPHLREEHCTANAELPRCEFTLQGDGGIAANGAPATWKVTITRPGRPEPIVLRGYGGPQAYPCGTVRKGDHVVAEAEGDGSVTVGNPGICI